MIGIGGGTTEMDMLGGLTLSPVKELFGAYMPLLIGIGAILAALGILGFLGVAGYIGHRATSEDVAEANVIQ